MMRALRETWRSSRRHRGSPLPSHSDDRDTIYIYGKITASDFGPLAEDNGRFTRGRAKLTRRRQRWTACGASALPQAAPGAPRAMDVQGERDAHVCRSGGRALADGISSETAQRREDMSGVPAGSARRPCMPRTMVCGEAPRARAKRFSAADGGDSIGKRCSRPLPRRRAPRRTAVHGSQPRGCATRCS